MSMLIVWQLIPESESFYTRGLMYQEMEKGTNKESQSSSKDFDIDSVCRKKSLKIYKLQMK